MAEIQVALQPFSQFTSEVNLEDLEWSQLLPESLGSFRIEEKLRLCKSFQNGLFPGAELTERGVQTSRVKKFPNYIEFSKVVSDEVVPISGNLYLTTKFFERRKVGWSSDNLEKKDGEVMAYCIDGDVYSLEDNTPAEKIFYGTIYRSLIKDLISYQKLVQKVKDGICLKIRGASRELLDNLSLFLRKDASGTL